MYRMECMDVKALKSSFASEKAMKSVNQQQVIVDDDIWCVTGDEFIVDDFLDIPNEENVNDDDDNNSNSNNNNNEEQDDEEEEEKYSNSCNSLSSSNDHLVDDSAHFSAHLAIPDDDMQELELWSHFMDDSVPEPRLPFPKSSLDAYFKQTGFTIVNRVEPCKNQRIASVSRFPITIPVKKRSKRSRSTRNRSWFTSSHPKSPSSTLSWESTLSFARPVHEMGFCYTYGKPVLKKPRKETTLVNSGIIGSVQRKCSHCQVTKTPQWRAGPNGPKTLCNACGVRFKSGRLFPEYRPACSPTFSSEVHSNSHRKVLEMRHKKEMVEVKAKPHTGPT